MLKTFPNISEHVWDKLEDVLNGTRQLSRLINFRTLFSRFEPHPNGFKIVGTSLKHNLYNFIRLHLF